MSTKFKLQVRISQHATERLQERFNIDTERKYIQVDCVHLHGDKYLFGDVVLVIINDVLVTVYPRNQEAI